MLYKLPPIEDVSALIQQMTLRQLRMLVLLSGVPEHTLLKIRNGQTTNPRYETVRAIMPMIRRAVREVA